MLKEKTDHGGSDDAGEFTVTVRQFGGSERKIKARKMGLKEFLKRHGYETRGYAFTLNGRQLATDKDGELLENPVLTEGAILSIAPSRITGGNEPSSRRVFCFSSRSPVDFGSCRDKLLMSSLKISERRLP